MEFLQFIGQVAPQLAPALLISWVCIRIILELLKERRELQEVHRAERKEWQSALEILAKDTRATLEQIAKDYRATAIEFATLGRDIVNQMHALKNEVTKYLLDDGRRKLGGND